MIFEINHKITGAVLFSRECGNLKLCVEAAVRTGANLGGANLGGANLWGANLWGAKNVSAERITPLLMLLDQPGKIRAYKLVNKYMEGPYQGGITYAIGTSFAVDNADPDVANHCGAGINLATLDWCLNEWREGYRILIAEFEAADIAAIPTATDGKFRVFRAKIVGEKDLTGLVPSTEEKEAA